ncbi:hypothetical protein ACIBLA_00570 [Streptomyces sp. NPDC050433]|uniref:hypothetical protein n=1 Tax=unclassified Streptomyces TaxID=2593676 RepID=UPI00342CEC42
MAGRPDRSITTQDEQPRVLLPAAEPAELEYWAQRSDGDPLPLPDAAPERPVSPQRAGERLLFGTAARG